MFTFRGERHPLADKSQPDSVHAVWDVYCALGYSIGVIEGTEEQVVKLYDNPMEHMDEIWVGPRSSYARVVIMNALGNQIEVVGLTLQ